MTTTEKAVAAHLLQQAEKFRALKELVVAGMDDVAAGRIEEWSLRNFLRVAHKSG